MHLLPRSLRVGALALLAVAPTASAGSKFQVDTLVDSVDASPGDGVCADADGRCSLRAAIQEANAQGGKHTIQLPPGYTFVLTLTGSSEDAGATGDLDVSSNLRIDGSGATIIAAAGDRVFDVGAEGQLQIDELTIRGGEAPDGENGGNIRNAGELWLRHSTIEGGAAPGTAGSGGNLFNSGTAKIDDCTLAGGQAARAGGAIEASGGETTLRRSQIIANSAGAAPGNGGGLHITGEGLVVVEDSEFDSNVAAQEGGGIWNATGLMKISGSRFSNNVANGDAADDGGGGVFNNGGTLDLKNTDILWNVATGAAGSGGGLFSTGGTVTIHGGSIVRNTAVRAGGGVEVIDGVLTIDKTLLEANQAAASPGNGGALHVTGTSTSVTLTKATVRSNTAGLEGGGLWNQNGSTMSVVQSTVFGNTASGDAADDGGGGIFNNGGDLNVVKSQITGNTADGTSGSGGGIFSTNGSVTISKSTISGNTASRAGGGVEIVTGSLDLTSVDVDDNSTAANPGNGGGVHVTGGTAIIAVMKCAFRGNFAAEEGGALWNQAGSTMDVTKSTFTNNSANGDGADQGGGALFNNGGTLNVLSSELVSNRALGAAGSGGGILNDQGMLTVDDSVLKANSARRAGGGIETNIGAVTMSKVSLLGNEAGASPGNGGGLHITGAGVVDATGGKIFNNTATNEGGGLWNSATGTLTVQGAKFKGNAAPTGDDVFTVPGGTTTIN